MSHFIPPSSTSQSQGQVTFVSPQSDPETCTLCGTILLPFTTGVQYCPQGCLTVHTPAPSKPEHALPPGSLVDCAIASLHGVHEEGRLGITAMPTPTEEILCTDTFEAIWQCIKSWDIGVPEYYHGHTGAMGNHVMLIIQALVNAGVLNPRQQLGGV